METGPGVGITSSKGAEVQMRKSCGVLECLVFSVVWAFDGLLGWFWICLEFFWCGLLFWGWVLFACLRFLFTTVV